MFTALYLERLGIPGQRLTRAASGPFDYIRDDGRAYKEVIAHRKVIHFPSAYEYNQIRSRLDGELLVFDPQGGHLVTIPFYKLPAGGGHIDSLRVTLHHETKPGDTTICLSFDDKSLLEELRGIVEKDGYPFKSISDFVVQMSLLQIIALNISPWTTARRWSRVDHEVKCPACDNATYAKRSKMVWYSECSKCGCRFVVKRA